MNYKKNGLLLLVAVFTFFPLVNECLSQRNLRLSQERTAVNDPFIGKWKWDNGSVRIVTADKIYDANDPNWEGKWKRIDDGDKLRFTYGPKEDPTAWVVIGTVNDDGTSFEGLNQLGKQKEYANKIK